jgi:hypothetical protein
MRLAAILLYCAAASAQSTPRSPQYDAVQRRLASGWNTWDVQSVTEHVLLPHGLAIKFGLQHRSTLAAEDFLADSLIGRQTPNAEQVFPGPHSWDGNYTDLRLSWRGHNVRIQSAHEGDDLVLLATPLPPEHSASVPPVAVFSVGFLWNYSGTVSKNRDRIEAKNSQRDVSIYFSGRDAAYKQAPVAGPYFSAELTEAAGISTGAPRSIAQIRAIVERERGAHERRAQKNPVADAIESTLGWDTIFEPEQSRVVTPISRLWCTNWGGWILADWDTFFVASLAAVGDRDLAYANAMEILREETAEGFVPNYARTGDWKSSDRSEPPVGAITVLDLYRRFHDRWFLENAFTPLLKWNRWWAEHRDVNGYLVWGSDGANQPEDLDDVSRGKRQGAIYESGLDNSPMYDGAVYDEKSHKLLIADVGLMGMYIADCNALAEIAQTLDRTAETRELRQRAEHYRRSLATLWDDEAGIFLNKDLRTGELSHHISPTNFYPMLARAASAEQASRMVREHLLNPQEFWGEWVIPSISRDDPGFKDQNYWRGRIWGPMNYLVYLGLRNYDMFEVRRQLAEKSLRLFLREWREKGHVHENYNAITGDGDDVRNSDRFYHWGALLGLIQYTEQNAN